jgi:hypothetical protein
LHVTRKFVFIRGRSIDKQPVASDRWWHAWKDHEHQISTSQGPAADRSCARAHERIGIRVWGLRFRLLHVKTSDCVGLFDVWCVCPLRCRHKNTHTYTHA